MKKVREYIFNTPSGKTIVGKIIKGYVALYVTSDFWIIAKGYTLYKYYPQTECIEYFSKLQDSKTALLSKLKLSRRLFRAEITHLYKFSEDWFCIARKAIFKYNPNSGLFEICHKIVRGSRPMNLCQDIDGTIYYGEYFYNPDLLPVNIVSSKDNGNTWNIAYTFEKNEVNHIHGIFNDKYTRRLWVFTGDDDKACIAGYTTDGFKTIYREFEGKQEYRVCVPIFQKDSIIYPTDSPYTRNSIRLIDRTSKNIIDLQEIQGSGIYAAETEKFMLVSTTVEPSKVNTDRFSHLWYSFEGKNWEELVAYKKDILKNSIFQFGSIRFPYFDAETSVIVFTGRALKGIDQNTVYIPYSQL